MKISLVVFEIANPSNCVRGRVGPHLMPAKFSRYTLLLSLAMGLSSLAGMTPATQRQMRDDPTDKDTSCLKDGQHDYSPCCLPQDLKDDL